MIIVTVGEPERLEAELEIAKDEIERLRTALAPFANISNYVAHTGGPTTEVLVYGPCGGFSRLSIEDFERARQALSGKVTKICAGAEKSC